MTRAALQKHEARSTRIKAGAASASADYPGVAEAAQPAAAALLPTAPSSAVTVITAAAEAAAIEAVEATIAPAAPTPLPPRFRQKKGGAFVAFVTPVQVGGGVLGGVEHLLM